MIQLAYLIKALQEFTLIGKGPQYGAYSGFQPAQIVAEVLVHPDWNPQWSDIPAATHTALASAYLQNWYNQFSSYTVAEYYAGDDGGGRPWASATDVPVDDDFMRDLGGQIWYMLPRFRAWGVPASLVNQVSAWAATVFPAGNWAVNNSATCNADLSSCTSD